MKSLLHTLWPVRFLQNRPTFFLIIFSFIYLLWLTGKINLWVPKGFNLMLFLVLLVTMRYFIGRILKDKEVKTLLSIFFVYGIWIILSSFIHYRALSMLEPYQFLTVSYLTASWGLAMAKGMGITYLFFPMLLLLNIYLFKADYKIYRKLYLLTLIFLPSLMIAVYQGMVDIKFLNVPYFANLNQVSGLAYDTNAFGLSIFLLLPLCFLSMVLVQDFWKRLLLIILIVVFLWCLVLCGSRTGFAGIILFLISLPWVWGWANDDRLKRRWRVLFLCQLGLLIIIILGIVGLWVWGKSSLPLALAKRFHSSLSNLRTGGVALMLKKTARPHMWLQAGRLTVESPIAGWGPGGFYRNVDNVRFKNGEKLNFMDNALNHYLQISSEFGILGSLFNILLHLLPLWMVFRIRKRITHPEERWAVGIIFITISIMMVLFMTGPHTLFIDVQWIFTVYIAFLFVTALRHGYSLQQKHAKYIWTGVAFLTLLFIWGTYQNAFGRDGYRSRTQSDWWPYKYERNIYHIEKWSGVGEVRWCKKEAFLQVPFTNDLPATVPVSLILFHPDIQSKPVTVRYGGKHGVSYQIVVKDSSWKRVEIPVTMDDIFEFKFPKGSTRKYLVLSFDVSRTWVPKKWGVNNDNRELGVAILIPNL